MNNPNYIHFLSSRSNWIKGSALAKVMSKAAEFKKKGVPLISLAAGDPDPDLIPRKEIGELTMEILENISSSVLYTPTNGIYELRRELTKFLKDQEQVEISPENIVITVGGTGAIDLLGRVIIDPGDVVISENPSYINTLLAFRQLGADLVGVPVDENGMKINELELTVKKLRENNIKIKFVYTIPTGHNPMGVTMNEERRRHLLELASKHDFLIIEDAAYNLMKYEEKKIHPIKYFDDENRVIMIGTLSKVIGTGFRLGWLVAEREILKKVINEKQPIDFCAPTLSQYISLEYLKRGYFKKHHLKALLEYKRKRDTMLDSLNQYTTNMEFTRPIAGMFIMVFLSKNVDGIMFSNKLLEEKHVVVVPGKPFYINNDGANTIRLNFSRPSIEDIKEGVKKIAEIY